MALGFTESKSDSNLSFKDEGGIPVMLLLYVDDLFLIGKKGTHQRCRKETCCRVQDEGLGYDALIYRHGDVAECGWNLLGTREVCNRDPKEDHKLIDGCEKNF